jgi:hypothetical protein
LYKETGDDDLGGLGGEAHWQMSRWTRGQHPAVAVADGGTGGGVTGAAVADGDGSVGSGERAIEEVREEETRTPI